MSRYNRCVTCGDFLFEHHRCPPVFRVWCPEDGEEEDDANDVRALCAEDAATKWAVEDDSDADYRLLEGTVLILHVRDSNGILTVWSVEGETVPVYRATEVELD